MPRAVFKLLWDTIIDGSEIFAYVKNVSKTATIIGFWLTLRRRTTQTGRSSDIIQPAALPDRDIVRKTIVPIYEATLQEENKHRNGQQALAAGFDFLVNFIKSRNMASMTRSFFAQRSCLSRRSSAPSHWPPRQRRPCRLYRL